jgi:hypothetical protein
MSKPRYRKLASAQGPRSRLWELCRDPQRYNPLMSFSRLVPATLVLFSISGFAGRTDKSAAKLLEDFRRSKLFFEQIEIGKQIVSLNDPILLENLKDMLISEGRHVRGNTAFVFAGLGNARGLEIITDILQDRSYRAEGQSIGIAPGDIYAEGDLEMKARAGPDPVPGYRSG